MKYYLYPLIYESIIEAINDGRLIDGDIRSVVSVDVRRLHTADLRPGASNVNRSLCFAIHDKYDCNKVSTGASKLLQEYLTLNSLSC